MLREPPGNSSKPRGGARAILASLARTARELVDIPEFHSSAVLPPRQPLWKNRFVNSLTSSIRCHPDPGCPRQLEGWLSAASKPVGAEARGSRQLAPSRSSPTSLLPFSVHSHGSALPHGRGPQQGSQGDQERGQAEAQPPPRGEYQGARLVGRKPSRRRAGPGQRLPERSRSIEGRGNPGVLSRGKKNVRLARGESGKAGYPPVCSPFLRTPTGATYRDPPPSAVDSEAGAGATWEPVLTHE